MIFDLLFDNSTVSLEEFLLLMEVRQTADLGDNLPETKLAVICV